MSKFHNRKIEMNGYLFDSLSDVLSATTEAAQACPRRPLRPGADGRRDHIPAQP